jgi:hypothetical protein
VAPSQAEATRGGQAARRGAVGGAHSGDRCRRSGDTGQATEGATHQGEELVGWRVEAAGPAWARLSARTAAGRRAPMV